jgi:hypothetical protein
VIVSIDVRHAAIASLMASFGATGFVLAHLAAIAPAQFPAVALD